eukprot:CAMPEP_0197077834 /NCGR_PEP_ID=MMETSP1384-20130603/212818_1 /TAXON_ID=29189 /ORGANISM="Ammonia sp." /LENGTH=285 /DNA_ID=CAMNT_0042516699 /DNA_START=290 /DNA_END=1147 /DNA_ORIENTATION=-
MANSTMCNGYNAHKHLYHSFANYITTYLKGKLNIHLYFSDEMHSAAYWRNFLAQKVNEYMMNHPGEATQISAHYHGQIVIQMFDADDIVHPQKLQLMDLVYSNLPINGTVLHSFEFRPCRNYFGPHTESRYQELFATMLERTSDGIDYQHADRFSLAEMELLLNEIQFSAIDARWVAANLHDSTMLLPMNKQRVKTLHLLHNLRLDKLWNIVRAIAGNIEAHQGWPTTTCSALLATPYNSQYSKGQDQIFNIDTINAGYDFYVFAHKLGIYCQGDTKHKMAFGGD